MISYLQVEGLSKSFGEKEIFSDITFSIHKDQRVALIAKNGTGKSTLLKIISGIDAPDSGTVTYRNDVHVQYLDQNPYMESDTLVIDQVFKASNEITGLIRDYEKALKHNDLIQIEELVVKIDALKAWDYETKAKQILSQLKITDFDVPVGQLSGGQRKRVALAGVLMQEPEFLILDEPTNHLDLEMIEWLEEFLYKSKSTLLMVTHDRYFLDRVCNEIIEMDDNQIYTYKGNYTYYLEKREERIAQTNSEIEKARNLFRKELDWMRRMPQARATKAKYRIDSFYDIKDKASQKVKQQNVNIDVQTTRMGKKVLELYDINKSYGDLQLLRDFSYKFAKGEKVGIVGKNGTGKSTFLNIITGHIAADSGTIEVGETIKFGYYRQDGIEFNDNDKVIDAARKFAEVVTLGDGNTISVSQFLTHFLFPPVMQHAFISKLSGGEKRRLYLLTVLMQNPNFLILDEPTNDLDIMTLNVLEEYLFNFKGVVLIVSHDRFFMDKLVDHVFVFRGEGEISDFPGNYTQYRDAEDAREREIKKEVKEATPKKQKQQNKEKPLKLTYKERIEFEKLEKEIEQLQEQKEEYERTLSQGGNEDEVVKASQEIGKLMDLIDEKELRWLELSEKA